MDWPKIKYSSSKLQTEYKFIGGSWYPILLSVVISAAIFLPYFIVLIRGTLHPFLPFISQVTGSPPQSGVFNILIALASLLALIGLNLLHMSIRTQKKRLKEEWVRHLASLLNNISLIPGHLGIVGMIIVGSYPIDSYRSSQEWTKITLVPHAIGALSVFLGGLFYCMIITYVLFLIHPKRKQMLGIRILLICLLTMCSALQGITVNEGFWPLGQDHTLKSCIITPDSISYNLSYLISSVSEWLLVLIFIVFFTTLKYEAKDISFIMTVTVEEEVKYDEIKKPKKEEKQKIVENQVTEKES